MEYRATIGGIEFTLAATGSALLPAFRGHVLRDEGCGLVQSVVEAESVFLVLDYRRPDTVPCPAYVEWWKPAGDVEGSLKGMFVFAASPADSIQPAPISTLSTLVREIEP